MPFDCFKMHPKCKAECCICAPIDKKVYERNRHRFVREVLSEFDLGDAINPITDSLYCPFLNENLTCNIQDDKPEVCKKFGDESHPCLRCSFLDKDGKERSRQQRRKISREGEKNLIQLNRSNKAFQEKNPGVFDKFIKVNDEKRLEECLKKHPEKI